MRRFGPEADCATWAGPSHSLQGPPGASCWRTTPAIPDLIGGKSGGEKRLLLVAASLGGTSTSIVLGDQIAGLDCSRIELVSIPPIHAVPPLASWPEVSVE